MAALRKRRNQAKSDPLDTQQAAKVLLDQESWSQRTPLHLPTLPLQLQSLETVQATLEGLDYKPPQNLDASLVRALSNGEWLKERRSLIVTGPTGVGKTYLACAFAHQMCRLGHTALYAQTGRLLQELSIAKGDGRYLRLMAAIARTELLVLDDWGLDNPTQEQRRILLELLDDRYERGSTLIASQFPIDLGNVLLSWRD